MTETTPATRRIKIWDLPLRFFHWALLACVLGAIVSVNLADQLGDAMEWHKRFGFGVLTLLIFRLLWGFIGGRHARFASFVRSPGVIIDYLRHMKDHKGPSIGHNPLGALSVLAMLAVLLFQAGSGLFITDEIMMEGPLFKHISEGTAHLLGELHEANAGILITLIGLHLAAIVFYRLVKRDNLIPPMITGNKDVPAETLIPETRGGSIWLGLLAFMLSAAAVWVLVTQS
ncbi:cytochrome b/b6 domain-containing protein [Uliginosibacterium sp. 31-16]|uniref:cytochrome b/b6 domain-containing protein n=1 Tax=Uliginosibacterium sp. 31-16 TaxID=3068315 RepID=UPI00273F5AFF|nr:cytochrome b/b6 domain-containing protein [Uliginosibacterium sp. 31-16]MDP5240204.1 cytochrome b/b6 domain-containing protein [Uliginosibacterium sp. 31-16]